MLTWQHVTNENGQTHTSIDRCQPHAMPTTSQLCSTVPPPLKTGKTRRRRYTLAHRYTPNVCIFFHQFCIIVEGGGGWGLNGQWSLATARAKYPPPPCAKGGSDDTFDYVRGGTPWSHLVPGPEMPTKSLPHWLALKNHTHRQGSQQARKDVVLSTWLPTLQRRSICNAPSSVCMTEIRDNNKSCLSACEPGNQLLQGQRSQLFELHLSTSIWTVDVFFLWRIEWPMTETERQKHTYLHLKNGQRTKFLEQKRNETENGMTKYQRGTARTRTAQGQQSKLADFLWARGGGGEGELKPVPIGATCVGPNTRSNPPPPPPSQLWAGVNARLS